MKPRSDSSAVLYRLALLLLVTGVLAVAGGLALILAPDGRWVRLDPTLLLSSPFDDFRIPGLVLLAVVGGAQLGAGVAVWRQRPRATRLAVIAALVLAGWIAIQAMMIGAIAWIQPAFLIVAIVELMMVAASLPRQTAGKRRFGRR
jgi:hypothetical protein